VKELKGKTPTSGPIHLNLVESGEGIERLRVMKIDAVPAVTWNPVKELKVHSVQQLFWRFCINKWNPVKELKVND